MTEPSTEPAALHIEPVTGLLTRVPQVLSPHCDARPKGVAPDLIVVHGITLPAGEFGGPWIDHLFAGDLRPDADPSVREAAQLRVSAHAVIRRDGAITQYVPFGMRAWHAGHSEYQGRSGCNDFSIGIELEGTDAIPYTDAQYTSLSALIRALLATYPTLAAERIAGHSDIAPGRKTDPGPVFEWNRLRDLLAQQR
ncbi:MAG TPA: 1,6-anhydro-N-acetylmuramyl-L-alanine amidase AmpD [Steroidobacteraceae bacterium]|jgi:AmpD protein|nr:1,6-anhydro-N-acetylmuramyl-L-alanine amidase AmpD [Steroidobacteraceae bacterium]